jgi:deoxyribodipyrimidine photolyase
LYLISVVSGASKNSDASVRLRLAKVDNLTLDVPETRTLGHARLQVFAPCIGRRYANRRNYDQRLGRHMAASTLSWWVERPLVTEAEVVAAALAAHGPEDADKFIEEVFWRIYFKGWLERHPQVWAKYCVGLQAVASPSLYDCGIGPPSGTRCGASAVSGVT